MLPVLMIALLVFAIAVILLWFIPIHNERRLIRLVRELEDVQVSGKEKMKPQAPSMLGNQK